MFRVKFAFWSMPGGYYYTEWFDTLPEARTFVNQAFKDGGIDVRAIEDENGEVN
ncbi:hypothetical protein [Stenotrophomonas virus Jojan60]|jgi:hypothetical protein|nr:hypothetical protein [Stenotrophomonas virus Jojan60]